MSDSLHDHVAMALADSPHLAGAFDWSKLIQAIETAIPVIMQIVALFQTPAPAPAPAPAPSPAPTPVH